MSTVVVLAGGTGGAKLARGMADVAGADLVVIANTADDVEAYGAHVSPDPDLCTFWLADRIDERGWGMDGDTFHAMDQLRELGVDVWFNLGDRDLAIGLDRAGRLADGATLTETAGGAHGRVRAGGARAADERRDRAHPREEGRRLAALQEFMIGHRGEGPVEDVAFDGIDAAPPSPEVLAAVAGARAIVIGPSNPVISVRPILDLPGMADALRAPPRRSSRSPRSSAARCSRARPRRSWRGRAPPGRRGRRGLLRGPARRDRRRRDDRRPDAARARHPDADVRRRGPRAVAAATLDFAQALT
jgi:LPPG:FO 2-phospho-L-lactate transferase